MSIIIRLQNLPWSANALDIRQYFHGLGIPEGGVHIVGGELGDAFIAFSTDEDARQAFLRNNGKIKEVQITLMLSSRTEMQRVIEQARNQSFAAFSGQAAAPAAAPPPLPAAVPPVAAAQVVPDDSHMVQKKKKRSRTRSKSRERDRSRDRKGRRYRDRSRSRERRDRRRRDRSRSRGRSRSRDKSIRRSGEYPNARPKDVKPRPEVWVNPTTNPAAEVLAVATQAKGLLGPFPVALDQAKATFDALQGLQVNGLPNNVQRRDNNWSPPQGNNSRGYRGNKFDMEVEEDQPDSCIMMEPFYGTYGDLRKFFNGLYISYRGIKLINDENGHRTGIVYIKFTSNKAKEDALARSGRELNGIAVKVSHLSDEAYKNAVDRYKPSYDYQDTNYAPRGKNITKYFNNHNGSNQNSQEPEILDFSCLKVEDLPNYAKEQDILHMFSLHPLLSLHLMPKPRGGHIAYVKFSSQDVARQALDERQHHVVGGKSVTVKPCADDEFEAISKEREVDLEVKSKQENVGTECLQLSKLPQKTNDRDIADFFSDIGLVPAKIHLMSNNLGFTGTAYCEFDNTEEATRASKKNAATIGNASIAVQPVPRQEMERVLRATVQQPAPLSGPAPQPMLRFAPPPRANFPMRGRGRGGFGPRGAGPRGPPRFASSGGGANGSGEEAPPGCTVYMDNVPYKAGTNEILEFFEGYNCTNNVSRRYNPNNTPSAEAKVTFYSPDDAGRAVQELHGQKIWERSIYLTQM